MNNKPPQEYQDNQKLQMFLEIREQIILDALEKIFPEERDRLKLTNMYWDAVKEKREGEIREARISGSVIGFFIAAALGLIFIFSTAEKGKCIEYEYSATRGRTCVEYE